jgi:poly(A) polymerase
MVTYDSIIKNSDPVSYLRALEDDGLLTIEFPELADLNMKVPAGYHHKNNWYHTLQVLDNALTLNPTDGTLHLAALLHDVGKPAVRRFEKNGVVTFYNHEHVGARTAASLLRSSHSTEEITDVKHLITLHMRAYGFKDALWTHSAVRRLMTDAGNSLQLERLLVIFRSDLTTKHASKRNRVLSAIQALEDAFYEVKAVDEKAALRPAFDGHELMRLTGLSEGRELGQLMKFLKADERIHFSHAEALEALRIEFPNVVFHEV